jgi:neutral trehalase
MHPSGHVVATSDCSNWQGPVWAPVNCLVATALARYGYAAEAAELAARTVSLFADGLRRHGCFHENYHSETGEPLAAPGIGSWCLMVSYLPADVAEPPGWWLRGLELP